MANPRPTNSAGLTNTNFTPTSDLQDAYIELRQFLTLRSSDELLQQSNGMIQTAQLSDNQSNKTLAISTLLSPDGTFLSKDITTVLQNANLTPDDIKVFGASSTSYGDTLYNTFGLSDQKFQINPYTIAAEISGVSFDTSAAIGDIDLKIADVKSRQAALIQLKPPPEDFDAQRQKLREEYGDLFQKRLSLSRQLREDRKRADSLRGSSAIKRRAALFTEANKSGQEPTFNNPHVALYRHASRYLDPASASSEYCNVFFNAIDSINMSLCVPYFRMSIVDRFAKKNGKYSKLTLTSFLKQTTDDASGDKIFYDADPIPTSLPKSLQKKLRSGKIVGMETFLSPQTLLPDPTEILSNPRRLDTSVPLLSLNSFSIGIESIGIALLSKKTADLSLTLHDRSRLTDISPLVATGNFSSLYFEIEWGWIHPHGAASFNNPVARYLNSLRFREIFSPTSYNMTMAEGGAMNINMRLIGGTSLDAVNGSILNGGFLTRIYASQMLDKLIKSELQTSDNKPPEDVRVITKVLIDKSRTANMVDRSFVTSLWEYADKVNTTPEDRSKLIEQLQDVLDQSDYYKNEEIFDIIKRDMPRVSSYSNSQQIFDEMKSKYASQIDDEDFTSVGTLLAVLVGLPLASTGLYTEVQIHTFKFNNAAGRMAQKQICDAPARIQDVFRNPEQQGSLAQNTSIANALQLIGNYLNNPKQPLYGISSPTEYSKIKVGDPKKLDKDPGDVPDVKAKDEADTDTFKIKDGFVTPNIRYLIRSVPAKIYRNGDNTTIANYEIDPEKTVAQIIIYDANASPNYDKIIGASSYAALQNNVDRQKITPDFAKDVFKKSFPSIVYGSTNSVVTSVSVSTDINNAIAQQNILDFGKDNFLGRSKSDASTDVSEITLFPGSVTVSMIGLPIIERGQEVYLDLGTGTTLDALYYVTAVKHDFRPGEFKTVLTLTYKGQGSVKSLNTMIEQFDDLDAIGRGLIKDKQKDTASTSAPTRSSQDPLQARREYQEAISRLQ